MDLKYLRCLDCGHGFCKSITAPCPWLTPTILDLAQTAYDNRNRENGELDRERLHILADALEEVGCSTEILNHLRSNTPHVRGCWVIDLLLDKE